MNNNNLLDSMIAYYSGDPMRIQHFIKVYTFAKMIGEEENLTSNIQEVLETAAIVHDIGIKMAEEKFNSSNGKLQEQEGPAMAEEMLTSLNYDPALISRVSYLVGHHHTYTNVDGIDYQILLEADFIVNAYKDALDHKAVKNAYERIFKTTSGKKILKTMLNI